MNSPGSRSQKARPGLRAEVITVGTELVQGLNTDTNSAWISARLASIGIRTDFHSSVGDNEEHMTDAILRAADRSDVVIVTGGLGPTADDLTREVVALAAGEELVLHQPSLDLIESMFDRWGRKMSDNNRSQAYLPEGADVLPNRRGTAPGFIVRIADAVVLVFPGVPFELHGMMDDYGIPHLRLLQPVTNVLRIRRIHCFGPGESSVDQQVRHLMTPERNPNVGLLVSNYIITVKISAEAGSEEEADRMIAETECEVHEILGDIVFGADGESMAEAVAEKLLERKLTIAVAESCTGGMIGSMLTDVGGVSACFTGGVIAYSNELKRDILGVPAELIEKHGAVSEPVARAMAEGVRRITGSDVAVAVTGVAGPTGGTEEKPVGLIYIAIADASGTDLRKCSFHGSRRRIRERTALTALDMVRRWAKERGDA